ncbi:MAG: ribonucleoside-triphosphate reductase [Gammaproteobacteria bacterium]
MKIENNKNEAKNQVYFRNILAEFVYLRSYARWLDDEKRRETWDETVSRYMDYMREKLVNKLNENEYQEVYEAILNQEVMPSMRLLQFSGKAAKQTNVCVYNCSYIAPTSLKDFGEVMYICMCGTGVGFSVCSHNIEQLPIIQFQTGTKLPFFLVEDTKEGWCDALVTGLNTWYSGNDIEFDFSLLRPAGARLKTFGGRSAGPEPLKTLLNFTKNLVLKRQGKKLTNINVHDILCKIGEVVVSGGVRRSAMISLSDLNDVSMRQAKQGRFYETEPQRSIANISAVYTEKPSLEIFMQEWFALMTSGSGERGIFNLSGLIKTLPDRRKKLFKSKGLINGNIDNGLIGANPCGEIILQSKQFCNLTEIIARTDDTEEKLLKKIRIAAIIGTYQATLTSFPYLSSEWKENCKQEALLGVSISGQWDCDAVRQKTILEKLKAEAIVVNQVYAKRFEINPATAITCIKPSGTVSQLVDCAPGMHPRFSRFYIRRIRISANDSLFKLLKKQGIPYHLEVGQTEKNASVYVLDFPVKSPEDAVFKDQLTAIEQLEYWKLVKINYTEHNPSVTIYVGEEEWLKVANWVYDNWDYVGGLSFLPRSKHVYQLAPYEKIDEKAYNKLIKQFENLDFSELFSFEREDETDLISEYACTNDKCEFD